MSELNVQEDGRSAAEIASIFQRLAQKLGQIQDTDLALEVILQQGQSLLGASNAAAHLVEEDGRPAHHIFINLAPQTRALLDNAFRAFFVNAPPELLSGALMIEDITSGDYPIVAELAEIGIESCLVLPLAQRGFLLGGLWFLFDRKQNFSGLELSWAVVLAGHAALALENTRLVDVALRQASELGAFYETAAAVETKHDLSYLLNQIVDQTITLLDCDMGVVYLAEEDRKVLRSVVHRGIPNDYQVLSCLYGEGVAGRVAESREPYFNDQYPDWLESTEAKGEFSEDLRVLCVPMVWRQHLIGVMDLAAEMCRRTFSETDVRLAKSIAYQAANALGIANLMESERRQ